MIKIINVGQTSPRIRFPTEQEDDEVREQRKPILRNVEELATLRANPTVFTLSIYNKFRFLFPKNL